jgi:oxygen-independent coproporphyrinogen-3 oxidase
MASDESDSSMASRASRPGAARQHRGGAAASRAAEPEDLGVYVHVPFCERVCPYCDFAVVAARPLTRQGEARYVDALLAELALRRERFGARSLASIYLGGGTPSLLEPDSVARILTALRGALTPPGQSDSARSRQFRHSSSLEVTLEVNPSNLERERLPAFLAAGVNRLSIGVQSFDDGVLRKLGRAHQASEARRTLVAARQAGFRNVSLDLIFGAPGASPSQLQRDLDEALDFAPEHLSAYQLTVEAGTPFALADQRGQLGLPNPDDSAELLESLEARLEEAGLARYEISSYARSGFESRHNQRYWARRPVLGLGMGAWSCEPSREDAPHGARSVNARQLEAYLVEIEAGRSPTAEAELLDASTARGETVFLALRRTIGLRALDFVAEFGATPRAFFAAEIERLVAADLLDEDSTSGDLALTARGRMLADSVFEAFV